MHLPSFKKIHQKQNILFDEFFITYDKITVIAFNYNGQGSALCRCDGVLTAIDIHRLEKVLFGVHKLSLANYLSSIFDPNSQSDELHRTGGELIFRSPELTRMKKYDLANLAKKTLKEVLDAEDDTFVYFDQQESACHSPSPAAPGQEQCYGNTSTKTIHKSSCNRFNPVTCTAIFPGSEQAGEAGYKPCCLCKP